MVRISAPQHLLIGLFVRDAAGLHPRADVDVPPAEPAVELRASLAVMATAEVSVQWARWWSQELARQGTADRGFFLPDARFGDGRELEELFRVCRYDAVRWAGVRKHDEAAALGRDRGREGDLVRAIETQLGRKAHPFELEVTELPVAGAAGWRVSAQHVAVSRAFRDDIAAYHRWLTPVIRELA